MLKILCVVLSIQSSYLSISKYTFIDIDSSKVKVAYWKNTNGTFTQQRRIKNVINFPSRFSAYR